MSLSECCVQATTWSGTPTGTETTLASNPAYVTGTNKEAAVLLVHDLFGWRYPNARLLADHYAREADVTVYVPDFFGGWVVDWALVEQDRWAELLPKLAEEKFAEKNSRAVRGPEIEACARALKTKLGFKRVGAIGFCYGGWAVAFLGSKDQQVIEEEGKGEGEKEESNKKLLVDAISIGHPTYMTRDDVDKLAVPTQVLAPEHDDAFDPDFKRYTFNKLLELNLPFEYVHFPGVKHGALCRGSEAVPNEREAMIQGKNSAVAWFRRYLH